MSNSHVSFPPRLEDRFWMNGKTLTRLVDLADDTNPALYRLAEYVIGKAKTKS